MMRNVLLTVLTCLATSMCLGAEVYPSKTVHIIVSFEPGSGTDLTARTIAQQLSQQLGRSFVVDNRPGAGGVIGNELVAKSAPDGYTLLMAEPGFTISPGLRKSLPYDAERDFLPIISIMRNPSALVVSPTFKATTVKELIALAQANPGKFNFGSAGVGSNGHMNGELFKKIARVDIAHVPYKGSAAAMVAVISDQVQLIITGIPTVMSSVNSGKVRALAVTTDGTRWPSMPDVPSMVEAGISGMALYTWYGLMGPGGLPKEIASRLHAEVSKALAVPSVKESLAAGGGELTGASQEEFARYIRSEMQRWAEVIKAAGIGGQ